MTPYSCDYTAETENFCLRMIEKLFKPPFSTHGILQRNTYSKTSL